jgi:elongation factor Tu
MSADNGEDIRYVEYRTRVRRYVHLDMPGDAAFADMAIGIGQLDALVLAVSALDGVTSRIAEHLMLARHAGLDHILIALTKADAADRELSDVVELEIRDLLSRDGYPGATVPVMRLCALLALEGAHHGVVTVTSLLHAMDTHLPDPARLTAAPFLLPVQHATPVADGGTAVTGTIRRGRVRIGQEVDERWRRVTAIETLGRHVRHAEAGDHVTLTLRPGLGSWLNIPVLAESSALTHRAWFTARIHLHMTTEDGPREPVPTGCQLSFDFGYSTALGVIGLDGAGQAQPGDAAVAEVELNSSLPLAPGVNFIIREDRTSIGVGTVVAVGPAQSWQFHMPSDW